MASIEVRDFEVMVNDVLRRIVNTTGISNVRPGSVIRTLVEATLSELSIQYYQISRIFDNMSIDDATGEDLERLIKILGVTRKSATRCTAVLKFGRSAALTYGVKILAGSVVSTYPDNNGTTIEFEVDEDTLLEAGKLSVDVNCTARNPGIIYVPMNTVAIINKPILNIEYVNNDTNIFGGSGIESDIELRNRAKGVFASLGKGTVSAIENAIMAIDEVQDVVCIDCSRGVGTADIVVVTTTIPPSKALSDEIESVAEDTKAAGINVKITYPTTLSVDVSITLVNTNTSNDEVGNAIVSYMASLGVSEKLIINQLERAILNACGDNDVDVTVIKPTSEVVPSGTQIIRCGTVTINGVAWNG